MIKFNRKKTKVSNTNIHHKAETKNQNTSIHHEVYEWNHFMFIESDQNKKKKHQLMKMKIAVGTYDSRNSEYIWQIILSLKIFIPCCNVETTPNFDENMWGKKIERKFWNYFFRVFFFLVCFKCFSFGEL